MCLRPQIEPAPLQLVDPDTLQCQDFNQSFPCDPACGEACPASTDIVAFIPSWGSCQSECTGLDQTTCENTTSCRVALNFDIYYRGGTAAYLGCFQIDHEAITSAVCDTLDSEDCSAHSECSGLYTVAMSNCLGCDTPRYKACIPEHQLAGTCTGGVTCQIAPPACPTGTTPGRETGGCWTGSCIPDGDCN